MSSREIVLIASRAVAFYLLCWVFDDLTLLPNEIRSVLHYLPAQTPSGAYYRDYDVLALVFNLIRIAVFSALAVWFYACGPRIQEYFLPEEKISPEE